MVFLAVLALIWSHLNGISGIVVDADTGKPIEGAVVHLEWTRTSGKWIGLRSTNSYKAVEVVTNRSGNFGVSAVLNPFVDPPRLTIYKEKYVCWNSHYIFPDFKNRVDFKWEKGQVFKLEKFSESYSYDKHVDFIGLCIGASQNLEEKKRILHAFDWELNLAFQERRKGRQK
jgi:hypothetical protein